MDPITLSPFGTNKMSAANNMNQDLHQAAGQAPLDQGVTNTYVMTPELEKVRALVVGYGAMWFNPDEEGFIPSVAYGNVEGFKAPLRALALAVLAAADQVQEQYKNDPSQLPILVEFLQSGYAQAARAVIRTKHNLVLFRNNTPLIPKEEFDGHIYPVKSDKEATLGDASLWTLCKLFDQQLHASVDRCFFKHLSGLPLVYLSHDEAVRAKANVKGKAGNARKEDPVYRIVEDATYNGASSDYLVTTIGYLKDALESIGNSTPDFSAGYKAAGSLRRLQNPPRTQQDRPPRTDSRPPRTDSRPQNQRYHRRTENSEQVDGVEVSGSQTANPRVQTHANRPYHQKGPRVDKYGFQIVGKRGTH